MRLLFVATAFAVMTMSATLTAAQTLAPVCSAFSKNLTECSANSAFCGIGVALGSNVETCRYKTCREYNSTICNLIPACAMDGAACGLKPCIAIPNNGTNCVDSGCQYVQDASLCGPSNCSALSATACPWNRCQVPSTVKGLCTFLQCAYVNPAVCRDLPGCNVSNTTANGPVCAPIITTTAAAANVTTTLAPLTATTAPTTINTTTAPRTTTPPVTAAPWTMPICSSFNLTSCPTDVCGRSSTTACKYKNCMEYNTSICSKVPACALDTASNTCTWKPCLKIPNEGTACFDSGCQRSPTSNTCAPPNCTALTATTCPLGRCVVSTTAGTSSGGSCAFPSCSALPPMVCSEAPLCQLNSLGNCTDAVTLPATTAASGNTTAPITVMPTPSPMTDRPPVTNASTSNQTSDMPPQTPAMTTGAVAPQTTMPPETSAPMPAHLPCLNYTAAACPLARCQLYSPGSANIVRVCIPQQCKTLANQSVCIGACTWNGTSCDRTPCDKLNVDTCTPEICNIGTDGTCTGKPCNELSADGCDTTRCYVNSNGKCAAQTCEMITVATRCTNSACFWDASKDRCTTPPCSSFVTATACPSPRCQVTSTGACGNAPCNTWMNAANCTVAPGCLWSTTQTCVDRPCQYFEATTCPIGRCQWDAKLSACTRPACSASNSSSSCPNDQCYWSTLTSTCSPIPCTQFTTNASCPVDRCYFNAKACQELPCRLIAQQAVCALNTACTWSMPSTSGVSGSATVSGTCQAKVVDVPCAQRTDLTTCVLPQCYNDVAKGKCTNPPCNLYTSASACPTDRCAFNASGNSVCTPIPCLALPSSTTCALFSERCAWDSNSGWCKPTPCENLGNNCDLARCTLTSSGACASIKCEAQLVKSQCPTSSFDCMWWNNQCGYGNCVLLRNQSACGTDSKCTWATPANADATCIATSFLASLPCSAFNGADFCASAPNSRCKWVSSQTTTGAVSGQCTPADLTSLLPCFNFTSQGQSACPTSYCAWWNNLCVNPLCTSATTQSGCTSWNCLWVASTTSANAGTCADQQWQQFPCSAFTAATCPAGRCSKNETKCVAFSSSSSGSSSSSSSSGSLSAAILAQLTTTSDGTWINATNGIPVDSSTKACLALTEARTCLLSTSACVWRGSLCTPPPCGQYTDDSCPTKRCRSIAGRCLELCPASNPYYCYASGTCATQASACKTCPSSQVQCVVDSSCQSSQTSCPCPDATPFRCPADQRCVTNITTDCLQCPTDAPVRCWDGSCSTDESGCPCPLSNPLLCSDNTTCVSRMSDCEVKCGKLTPVKCWNGACATSDAACPCSENLPFRCATDGKCYSSMDKCPCEDKTLQRCTTGRCVANTTTDCTSTATTCPAATPVACTDGSCAATSKLCGCAAAMATQLPLVEIATTASSFDITRFLQLAARVNYTVCGKDWTLIVSVVWSATEALTGKAVSGNLFGRVVSVPPNTFSAGTQYIITAAAYVNGSTTKLSSSASVIMLATAPTPELYVVGGNRTTPATNIGVAVQIKDAARTNADVVAWVCTGSDGVSACDSSISTPLLSVTGGFAQIPGPVAAGTYILTAFYKGISASMWLNVKATPVPNVQIIAPQDRTGALKSLFMYASVQNGGKTSVVTWYIGGTAVMTGSVLNYTMPTSTTAVIAKACDSVDNTACGQATYNYVPVTPVTGTCSLTATDGTASTAYTALATALSVSSTWTSTTATLKFAFYLEYRNNGVRTRMQLAPYDSEVSTLAFTAPMLAGNQAAQITVGVIARDAGSRETVATAVCDSVALAASTATTASIVTSQTSQLASALAVNDTSAVFSAAGALAAAAGQTGANASQLASQVLTAISSVVSSQSQDGSTMSRTARSAVIQTLSSTVSNAGSALTSAQQDETVKTVIAAITSPDSQNSIDVNTDGPAALALLSQVNATAAVSDATEKLSLQLAASATLGVPTSISSGNVSIAGVARTGDDIAGAVLNHSKCSLALPSNFNVSNTNSSSTVSLSVAQYDNTPVGSGGLNVNTTVFKSAIVEFNVQADGNRVNVSQLTTAIRVELQVTNVVNASQLTCRYFNKTAQMWTTNGVTTVGYDATRQVLKCDTTHLSMFGGSETTVTSGSTTTGTAPSGATPTPATPAPGGATASPGTPATPTPAGPGGVTPAPPAGGSTPAPGSTTTAAPGSGGASPSDSGPSSSTVGAIVGGCIAGLFCVVVAGFLVVRSRANHGTGFNGDVEMADNSAPLTAMGQQLAARPGYNQL